MNDVILTPRLELRAGTRESYSIPYADRDSLARVLGVNVPGNWPVENYDGDPLVWCIKRLDEDPGSAPWLLRYFIERESNTLIGFGGGGEMADEGSWIIGYSVLPQFRRVGYASEAVKALIEAAFAHPHIERLVAETYPELVASIGVLEKNGFKFIGNGSAERVIRYELRR
jgi:ribosomal-protein-alanine N-acetyltransferase